MSLNPLMKMTKNNFQMETEAFRGLVNAWGDCLIGCPPTKFCSIEQWRRRMVVIVTGYTLFVTS